jgi:hypothetical protein
VLPSCRFDAQYGKKEADAAIRSREWRGTEIERGFEHQ